MGGGSNPYIEIHVPEVASGGSQQIYNPISSPAYLDQVVYQTLALSIGNSPSTNTNLQIQGGFDSGINTTGSIPEGTTREQALVDFGISSLSSLPPAGFPIGAYSYENSLDGASGVDTYQGSGGANGVVYQNFRAISGGAASSTIGGTFKNVWGPQEITFVDIPESEWLSSQPQLTLTATNVVGNAFNGLSPTYTGATASIPVYAVPAVNLSGQVPMTALGKTLSGTATVNIQATSGSQSGTIFQVPTDSSGNYHFFAQVGTWYSVWASYKTSFGTAVGSAATPAQMPLVPTVATVNPPAITAISDIYGHVSSASTGAAIAGAAVSATLPAVPGYGCAVCARTDSNGNYYFWAAATGTYTVQASASGYKVATAYPVVSAMGTAVSQNFALTASSGGGGGCVVAGTEITATTTGGQKRVEQLSQGDSVLGFDITSASWVKESVTSNSPTNVIAALSINNGLLTTTLVDQPLYVRNGTWTGWVHNPLDLSVGEQVYNPLTGSWTTITSLQLVTGSFTVYDLRVTAPNDFVANGLLTLDKIG